MPAQSGQGLDGVKSNPPCYQRRGGFSFVCTLENIMQFDKTLFPKFNPHDLVRKKSGSEWEGRIVGCYSTSLTPEGYAVESSAHPGSVQIYPAGALEPVIN